MKEKVTKLTPQVKAEELTLESLSELDKERVDSIKIKRELALANVKNALTQSENTELQYSNLVLQLTIKYKLSDGDVIREDGSIQRC